MSSDIIWLISAIVWAFDFGFYVSKWCHGTKFNRVDTVFLWLSVVMTGVSAWNVIA